MGDTSAIAAVDTVKYQTLMRFGIVVPATTISAQTVLLPRVSDKLIHADFLQIVDGKPVTVHLPVKTIGMAEGVKDGGKLHIKMRKLKVKGLINKLPERIELNIEKLTIGKAIAAGDIKLDGITILHPDNITVVSVQVTRAVVAEETTPAAGTSTAPAAGAAATPAATATPAAGAKAAPADKKK